jgi:HAD superfamily hydrolase (TIGR01509 family)
MNTTWITQRSFWIFDLDGTLTVPVHDFAAIKRELSLDPDTDILSGLAALSEKDRTERMGVLNDIEKDLAENALGAPGGDKLLDALTTRGCKLGILTRNAMDFAWLSLRAIGLDHHFGLHSVIGRDEAMPKPDPEGLFKLLDLWKADPGQCVMVGDYLYDLEAGKSAGMATIHVDSGDLGSWPEVTDLRVDNLDGITVQLGAEQV